MVGRDDELAALEATLEQAASGSFRLVLIAGEAGVGKTRLAREFADRASAAGRLVLWGECVPIQAGDLPYTPIVGALRTSARSDERPSPGQAKAAELVEALVGSGVAEVAPVSSPHLRVFELLLQTVGELSSEAPVVLVIEDLHWADPATQDVLRFLARNLRRQRVLLLVTLRNDDPLRAALQELLETFTRTDGAERLDLDRLTPDATALQVAAILGRAPEAALVEWVHARGDGNPYFAEEFLAVRARGDPAAGMPASLRSVLLRRIASVSSAARQGLAVIATAGHSVTHDLLQRAAGMEETLLNAALRELLDAHVIVRDRAGDRYTFRHALSREAAYDDLLPPERRALHARWAKALEDTTAADMRTAADWAALAYHWDRADRRPPALRSAIAAADSAARVYAFASARAHLERARALWQIVKPEDRPNGLDELELVRRLADAARLAGDRDGAIPIVEQALAGSDPHADPLAVAGLYATLGRLIQSREPALRALERALELLPDGPSAQRASVMLGMGAVLEYGQVPSSIRHLAAQALDVARAACALAEEGRAHNLLGAALAFGGRVDDGLAHFDHAIRIARELDQGDDLAIALNYRGNVLLMLGRAEAALASLEERLEEVRRAGLALSYGLWLEETILDCELRLGRWEQARARLERLARGGVIADEDRLLLIGYRLVLDARQGRFEAAHDLERQALELIDRNVAPSSIAVVACGRAELALLRSDAHLAPGVVAAAREAVGNGGMLQWPELLTYGIRAHADLALRARALGLGDEIATSRTAAVELIGSVEREGTLRWYQFEDPVDMHAPPELQAQQALGDAELSRLDSEPRPALWRPVVAAWDDLGYPYFAAYARWRLVEAILARGGDRREAAALLGQARRALADLAALPLLNEVDALARRARLTLAEVPLEPATERPFGLTERELTVLERVAAGRTNRQIADELFLSTRTVDMHVRNILPKLGAANRVEAAAAAHHAGLAPNLLSRERAGD